jgi:hydroxypyruvate reductase
VADPTTFADALALVNETGLRARFPRAALERLERGARGQEEETVKPGDPRLARSVYRLIGNRLDALAGAREAAETRGYRTVVISTPMVGEAREAGVRLMDLGAQSRAAAGRPLCLLAAGETTVHVRGTGKGGRNQELALAAAARGLRDAVFVLASVGTDGIDGPTDAAGAIVDSTTLARAAAAGVREPQGFLDENDSYRFFEPLGDLIKTGPTDTNVGDVQVLLVSGGVAPG